MFTKLASAIEMSFEVPSSEKEIATAASKEFTSVINSINQAKTHLDIMYDIFKKHENISPEATAKHRGKISRFKKQVKENFNKIKGLALKSIQLLNYFSTDTHTLEMINAFRDSVQDLEKQVTIFMDILDDYRSADFRNNVIAGIEGVKKHCAQVEKLIKDRIIDHIDANILAKNWVTNTGDALRMKIKDRVPMITELFNERQKAIENQDMTSAIDIEKRPQILNSGNAGGVYYSEDRRGAGETSGDY